MTILDKIVRDKKNSENHSVEILPIQREMKNVLQLMDKVFFLIAETKKGSPSKGIIRENYDPLALALEYQTAGASAISVLTESNYFFGSQEDFLRVRPHIDLPLLRKDFIFNEYQVIETYNMGADLILLIVAILDPETLSKLYHRSLELGLTPLIEVHNKEELDQALALNPALIGINNRDLKTFEISIQTSIDLKKYIPENIRVISESGIKDAQDIRFLREHGFQGALVGESILRQDDVKTFIQEMIHG